MSYASEDAEAARCIAEALRGAGVTVWIDLEELRGGDAWDQKIRRQIKECALFVAVISRQTVARLEGYFRIEWKLAAQRTHGIADEKAFLLPVVVDETAEPEASVPIEFRNVQWTKVGDERGLADFAAHVRKLLSGEPDHLAPSVGVGPTSRSRWPRAGAVGGAAAVAIVSIVGWIGWKTFRAVATTAKANVGPDVAEHAEVERIGSDAWLQRLQIGSRQQIALAEDQTRRATEAQPDSAEAWVGRALVQAMYLMHGWDTGERPRREAQTYAQKALALDPENPRALSVLVTVLFSQSAYAQAEAIARRILARHPDDEWARVELAVSLSGQGRPEAALDMMHDTVRRHPNSGANYVLAELYETEPVPNFAAAFKNFEASALNQEQPLSNILLHEASLLAGWKGDLAAARATLEKIDSVDRMEDRAVGIAMVIALLRHRPGEVFAAGGLTAREYFEDRYVPGPKAWLLALAYQMDGKDTLARQQWERAEAVLRERLAIVPANSVDTAALAVTLAWQGRSEEARKLIAPIEASLRESPPRVIGFAPEHLPLLYLAYCYAGLGDAENAARCLRPLLNRRELLTTKTLPLDPWWNKIRGAPLLRRP